VGDRDIVTLSSGWAAQGWAEKSTTSASIRWIRLNYTYQDKSYRVLVYCLEGHNMLGWCMYNWLWKSVWLNDNTIFFSARAYPLLVWLLCMWFFYFCDDHQFIDVSRCERYSRSIEKGWFCCIVYLGWTLCFIWAFP